MYYSLTSNKICLLKLSYLSLIILVVLRSYLSVDGYVLAVAMSLPTFIINLSSLRSFYGPVTPINYFGVMLSLFGHENLDEAIVNIREM